MKSTSKNEAKGSLGLEALEMRKCRLVIQSCTTEEQLGVAKIYAKLLLKKRRDKADTVQERILCTVDQLNVDYMLEMQRTLLNSGINADTFYAAMKHPVE